MRQGLLHYLNRISAVASDGNVGGGDWVGGNGGGGGGGGGGG